MPKFKGGTTEHKITKKNGYIYPTPYIRITCGPQRDCYVHTLIAEAKIGRKLEPGETVEHRNGNGLDNDPPNIIVVTRAENSALMHERRKRGKLNSIREWLE